jgi:two-component system cell cycle response regulator DivK
MRSGRKASLIIAGQTYRAKAGRSRVMQNGVTGQCAARKVLIVEDNMLNMRLFNDLLEAHGYTVFQAMDGLEALSMARLHRPDLILMDIQLPEMSGLEVTEQLKADAELRGIPIVALTAFAMKGDEEKVRQAGCDGYLTKPISITGFIQTVERYSSLALPTGS